MKNVLFVLILLVVSLAVLPIFLPKSMYVEEEFVFDQPIEKVYHHFNDLKKFTDFNATIAADSAVILNFSNPSFGEEAQYTWQSTMKEVGDGSVRIVETRTHEFIIYNVVYGDSDNHTSEVIFQRINDEQTRVIWAFDGAEVSYPYQVMNFFMKGKVKSNLRKSMENLQALLQRPIQLDYSNLDVDKGGFQIVEQEPKRLFGILQQTSTMEEEMNTAMGETFGFIRSYLMDANNLNEEEIGLPVVIWKEKDSVRDVALFYCGFMIDKNVEEVDDMEYVEIPSGQFLTTFHNGDFNTLDITHNRLRQFADSQEIELSRDAIDIYHNEINESGEEGLRTQIFIPVLN